MKEKTIISLASAKAKRFANGIALTLEEICRIEESRVQNQRYHMQESNRRSHIMEIFLASLALTKLTGSPLFGAISLHGPTGPLRYQVYLEGFYDNRIQKTSLNF